MAYPQVRSVGTVASGTGALSVSLPAGWQENDIFVLLVETANEGIATPSGWTLKGSNGIGTGGSASGCALLVYWKRATASEAAVSLADSGDHTSAAIAAVQGCVTTGDPWGLTIMGSATVDTTNVTWINFNTSSTNETLVLFALAGNRDATSTNDVAGPYGLLGNLTEHLDSWHSSGFGGGLYLASGEMEYTGNTDNVTGIITSQTFVTFEGSLKPAVYFVEQDYAPVWNMDGSVYQDYVYTYQSYVPFVLAPSWFDRLTSGKETWSDIETVNENYPTVDLVCTYQLSGSVYTDLVVTYSTSGKVDKDFSVTYQVSPETGTIGGGGELPFGTAEITQSYLYDVFFGAPSRDFLQYYRIVNSREISFPVVYTIVNSPYVDLSPEYQVGGAVELDVPVEYQVLEAIYVDLVPTYQIIEPVVSDYAVEYQIASSIAYRDTAYEYNVTNRVEQDYTTLYRVLNVVDPLDLLCEYQVYLGAEVDLVCVYDNLGSSRVLRDATFRFDVDEASAVVPNVVGLTLRAAKQVLRDAGLKLGRVTTNG